MEAGHVYFVAVPIGNIQDITLRAISILKQVDVILAEDTRNTLKLLRLLNIPMEMPVNSDNNNANNTATMRRNKKAVWSHHEHNWFEEVPRLLRQLKNKEIHSIAVVSDAGTPGISDPGQQLAAALGKEGIPIHPIPGPSAIISALSVCGFNLVDGFKFVGFIPAKGKQRKEKLAEIVSITTPEGERSSYGNTVVAFYEAPHRILQTFNDMIELGNSDRQCVCCRELTKIHEDIIRGTVAECLQQLEANDNAKVRGEFVIILDKQPLLKESEDDFNSRITTLLRRLEAEGVARSQAVLNARDSIPCTRAEAYRLALQVENWGGEVDNAKKKKKKTRL